MGKASFFAAVGKFMVAHYSNVKKMRAARESGNVEGQHELMREIYDGVISILSDRFGVKLDISGYENIPEGPVLYVANHQGMFDAAVMAEMPGPCGFVLKKEHSKIPFVSNYLNEMNCVFIDRENPRAAVDAINKAAEIVMQGNNMVIFPEGTRSRNDNVGEFKNGAFKIAQKTKATIVPVAVSGSYKLWEEKGTIVPGTVKAHILPPVHVKELDRREYKELGVKIRTMIVDELPSMK